MSKHGISVVIPCLNEEESIGQVIDAAREGIAAAAMDGEVIVVDNGSDDLSPYIARKHGARVVVELERGYGAAIRKGFAAARNTILVMADGDMTYDLTRLGDLVQPILDDQADMVVGNRMKNIQPGAMPTLHRYFGNPVLSLLLRLMFHRHIVRDAHCGMRAISKAAYEKLDCVTTGMEFASEMIVRAIYCRVRMMERDIIYHPRIGESKLASFRDGWRHLRFMLLHSPTTALLFPGILVWLLGTAIVLPLAFGPIVLRGRTIDIHCMIMGGLLNVISMQLITLGLLSKAYAHHSGLRYDPIIVWAYRRFTFEKLILATLPLVVIGVAVTLKVVVEWIAGGFGSLDEVRTLFLGMLCLVNGTQIGAAGYLFSIMALPRHVGRFAVEVPDSQADDRKK